MLFLNQKYQKILSMVYFFWKNKKLYDLFLFYYHEYAETHSRSFIPVIR